MQRGRRLIALRILRWLRSEEPIHSLASFDQAGVTQRPLPCGGGNQRQAENPVLAHGVFGNGKDAIIAAQIGSFQGKSARRKKDKGGRTLRSIRAGVPIPSASTSTAPRSRRCRYAAVFRSPA